MNELSRAVLVEVKVVMMVQSRVKSSVQEGEGEVMRHEEDAMMPWYHDPGEAVHLLGFLAPQSLGEVHGDDWHNQEVHRMPGLGQHTHTKNGTCNITGGVMLQVVCPTT